MKTIILFFVTFFISFVGSIHPGPVNLSVIQSVLRKNFPAALWIGLGGALVEIPYGYLALQGIHFVERYPTGLKLLQLIVIPILILLGVLALLRKPQVNPEIPQTKTSQLSFLKGAFLSLINGQLPIYWFAILLNYQVYPWLRVETGWHQAGFVAGASVGSFALQCTYATLARKYQDRLMKYLKIEWMERIIGLLFIAVGIWQALLFFWKS
ncbi:LysE family translocator [Siphonobacter sp. SORGH_AS_1065]|uniref:LysE family translocator n=1 Tax=Siphonobacter sp. SORGH_AS_1065 TaxID=3041795 RepID=UPI002784A98B|nr:LysE family transporter [Siphonobacter sp. SORGH_AS_1065]MDQ1087750.1 threonine/homoserine/homoserine lactone efflux protein [Siphonobacter sp. SORGH_AS_1065]